VRRGASESERTIPRQKGTRRRTVRNKKGWMVLIIMAVLTPIGIIAVGGAWGEWDLNSIEELVGYTPKGMRAVQERSPAAPFPDYEVPALAGGGWRPAAETILSALIGAALTATIAICVGRLVIHGGRA
jgi:ABC-type Fe3+ transport system permease subunit